MHRAVITTAKAGTGGLAYSYIAVRMPHTHGLYRVVTN